MKPPLLPLAILFCAVPLALASSHPGSHSGTHTGHHAGASSHHTHRASTVRVPHPARHVTYEEKKTLFDRAGIPRNQWHNYIVDHRIPLELGGSNDLSNLQIQDKDAAHRKDRVENYLAGRVRRGEISLSEAQSEIQHWQSVHAPG